MLPAQCFATQFQRLLLMYSTPLQGIPEWTVILVRAKWPLAVQMPTLMVICINGAEEMMGISAEIHLSSIL